jgi:hypothetical protein
MKYLVVLSTIALLIGCAEKAPSTPEQQWQGYCKSVGNAGRTIMLDRQNAIEKDKALAHANKVEDEMTRQFVLEAIELVYAMPEEKLNDDVKARRDEFRAVMEQKCLATPFEKLPDYKQF